MRFSLLVLGATLASVLAAPSAPQVVQEGAAVAQVNSQAAAPETIPVVAPVEVRKVALEENNG